MAVYYAVSHEYTKYNKYARRTELLQFKYYKCFISNIRDDPLT